MSIATIDQLEQSRVGLVDAVSLYGTEFPFAPNLNRKATVCLVLAVASLRYASLRLTKISGSSASSQRCYLGTLCLLEENAENSLSLGAGQSKRTRYIANSFARRARHYNLLARSNSSSLLSRPLVPSSSALFEHATTQIARMLSSVATSPEEKNQGVHDQASVCEIAGLTLLEATAELFLRANVISKTIACWAAIDVLDRYSGHPTTRFSSLAPEHLQSISQHFQRLSDMYSLAPSFAFLFQSIPETTIT